MYLSIPTGLGPYADFQLGLGISANNVENINTAKSPQKNRILFASRQKSLNKPGSCLGKTYIFRCLFLEQWIIIHFLKFQEF